ncbi:MAG: endonuclease [Candidatus Parcubacteria bacterium]
MVRCLKKLYPKVYSEMHYETPMQFLACVIMSAQFTDAGVNRLTKTLWQNYKTVDDFANATPESFAREIRSISYFNSKAKYIVMSARIIRDEYGGIVPKEKEKLVRLPGVGSKTANVVLGQLYGIWDGIPVDTHVKRYVRKFDICTSTNADVIERELCLMIPKKDWKYVNNGMVLYGRYVCPARKHDCTEHPLTKLYPIAAKQWPKAA